MNTRAATPSGRRSPRPRHGTELSRDRVVMAEDRSRLTDHVLSRSELVAWGVDRFDVAREVAHGRWAELGRRTIATHCGPLTERALWRHALYEVGSAGALDGVSALRAAGLTGFEDATVVSVRHGWQPFRLPGIVVHELRGWNESDVVGPDLRRVRAPLAAVRAASWARTDRQAALLLVMVAQQRIARGQDMLAQLPRFIRLRRRQLIKGVLADVTDGVQSLGELDFTRECRRRGLPEPSRQVVRRGPQGRVFLDAYFDEFGVIVEIEGAHHDLVAHAIDDALRQNALTTGPDDFVRIPVIGFRTRTDAFMKQVELKLASRGWRRGSSCG